MKRFRLTDSLPLWTVIELAVLFATASFTLKLVEGAGADHVGRVVSSATVLLSVVMAIVIQLWVKLNDLSAMAALTEAERGRLSSIVKERSRALIALVIFFLVFIFYLLSTSAIASSGKDAAGPLLAGVGAGLGACVVLIAAMLVDLNEVAQFRWTVEMNDCVAKRREKELRELRAPESGFADDASLRRYTKLGEQ